jgi:Pectate lyase superfamily protein/Major tropism determinant N-terminal domain
MSVVQISRIQQRRGKKNTDYGFPQLASGEIGWAIDTQELYIGNGAVSEGAPYVGNSKILTEHDDILQLVSLYQYQKNNPAIQTGDLEVTPVQRSLQARLDDIVSIKSFGAIGDGTTDDTAALQRAFDQLFLISTNISSRVVLYIEPGTYVISNEIRIPPYTHIVGAGIDSTKIVQNGTHAIFRTVDGNSTPGSYTDFANIQSLERPRYILISGLTLQNTTSNPLFYLDDTDSSLIDRVKFIGTFNNGSNPNNDQIGVKMRGYSGSLRNSSILFNNCIFNNTTFGIYSESDHNNINIENCVFYQLYDAINIGGGVYGSVNTNITNCYFDLIDRHGIKVKLGYGNTSSNNKFMLVGNNNEGDANATYPIILFETENNQSMGDYFNRNKVLKDQSSSFLPFVPNVQSPGMIYDNTSFHIVTPVTYGSSVVLMRLPLFDSGRYVIDYVLNKSTNGVAMRSGSITITVDIDNNLSFINDSFSYTGSSSIENVVFSSALHVYKNDPSATIPDTLTINILNPAGTGYSVMNYTYRMLAQ